MNKRQTEKHNKRKWRQLLADVFNDKLGIRVKPSRIKTYIRKSENAFLLGGIANGYELKLKFTAKEGRAQCRIAEGITRRT